MPTIFVQIASYRDPECQKTVQNLFDMAAHPERVCVGICWQYDKAADKDCFRIPSPRPEQTRISHFSVEESRGVCWARHEAQKLFNDEDYVLMIDSHMRFVKGWDELLIAELALCDSAKPVLSCYPPAYELPDKLADTPYLTIMCAQAFDEYGDIRFKGESLARTPPRPLNGAFIAAGFLFAPGRLVQEVPYDPHIYFNQEEITLCARMYTHGWDVFSPARIICYHLYHTEQEGKHRHWGDHKGWEELQKHSRQRSRYLLGGVAGSSLPEIEKYGLGRERSLKQFELYSGLDFVAGKASERAMKAEFIKELPLYQNDKITPLKVGDFMPSLEFRDDAGRLKSLRSCAGHPVIMCLLPSGNESFNRDFFVNYKAELRRLRAMGMEWLLIAQGDSAHAAAMRAMFDIPQPVLADDGGRLARLFGVSWNIASAPLTIMLEPNQRIIAFFNALSPANHLGDIMRMADRYNEVQQLTATVTIHQQAPVTLLPMVLDDSLRRRIIESGIDGLDSEIDTDLSRTMLPEIARIGAFEPVRSEPYMLAEPGRYPAASDGLRRYSAIIFLDDNGGGVRFPEYGKINYRPSLGGVVCFPSSLVYEIMPPGEVLIAHFHA